MKKYLLIGSLVVNVVLVGALLMINRKNHSQIVQESLNQQLSLTSRREEFKDAQKNVKRFVDSIVKKDTIVQSDFVRAYKISSKDMLEVMGISEGRKARPKYDYCRAYLGLSGDDGQFKLYLTPVKDDKDVFLNFQLDPGETTSKVDENSYVLNLIAPCPNTCDKMSPLYNFKEIGTTK